jgi:hypothetical protein
MEKIPREPGPGIQNILGGNYGINANNIIQQGSGYIVDSIPVTIIGHVFRLFDSGHPDLGYVVADYIMDQPGFSNCDGKMEDPKELDLTHKIEYIVQVYANTPNKRITVIPPRHMNYPIQMEFTLERRATHPYSHPNDASSGQIAQTNFLNFEGIHPEITESHILIPAYTSNDVYFLTEANVSAPISFSSFVSKAVYPQRLHHHPQPYTAGSGSLLTFAYNTSNPVDPGPFVFIS